MRVIPRSQPRCSAATSSALRRRFSPIRQVPCPRIGITTPVRPRTVFMPSLSPSCTHPAGPFARISLRERSDGISSAPVFVHDATPRSALGQGKPKGRRIRPGRLALAAAVASGLGAAAGRPSSAASAAPPVPFSIHEARGAGQPLARHWVDLDGDGRRDLVVVTGRSTLPRPPEEDRVSALVSWLHVTPSFLDRREVLLFRQADEGLQPWGAPLALPGDCSALDVADLDGDGRPEIVFSAGYRVYAFARPA